MKYVQYPNGETYETDRPDIFTGAKVIPAKQGKALVIQQAKDELLKLVQPGDTVYTNVTHVARSGMSRTIYCHVTAKDHEGQTYIRDITGLVAKAAGYREANGGGLKVGGCGMDMGFSVVYSLSSSLFRGGFTCAGKGCPSNDHSNGDRDYTPHHHADGGYALRQRWL